MKQEICRRFRAMNTDVTALIVVKLGDERGVEAACDDNSRAEAALRDVERLFTQVETIASRFDPKSELSRLNQSAGKPFLASRWLFWMVEDALHAARSTGGFFDPTILNSLVAAGYDRSFERIGEQAQPRVKTAGNGLAPSWRDVLLDANTSTIQLPEGCGLDLGGIGKGWTVDRAAEQLRPFENYAIDAGGDMFVAGTRADGSAWTVSVDDPFRPGNDLLAIEVRDQAVATSSRGRRRWSSNGQEMHHLIDPRRAKPVDSDVYASSVVTQSTVWAEVLAKTTLVMGQTDGLCFLEAQPNAEGMLVLNNQGTRFSSGFRGAL